MQGLQDRVDRVLSTIKNNQQNIIIAGAAVGTAALGYYGIKAALHGHLPNERKAISDEYFSHNQGMPLYATEATLRDRLLSNVGYELVLNLQSRESKTYSGRVRVQFMVSELATKQELEQLFLDFHGQSIIEMKVNDSAVNLACLNFSKHRIMIPSEFLNPNSTNHVSIKFQNTFVDNSAGLHKYIDPADNEMYIYTHLEPFYCNRWFPCFDQPSLRAPLKLTVLSPESQWMVIGNGKKVSSFALNDISTRKLLEEQGCDDYINDFELKSSNANLSKSQQSNQQASSSVLGLMHIFEETPAISTYVYSLCAGRFKCFLDQEHQAENSSVPMRIFTTQSKSHYLDWKELFKIMTIGINYFEDFFGIKYPFTKLDQIFLPDLRIAAMENVGAITFDENYFLVPQEEQTDYKKFRLAYLALHELSHMWFGNLVTMKWWNDLWLKESFADYMAISCMMECEGLSGYLHSEQVFIKFLFNALHSDTKSTTHPIYAPVKHTIDAENLYNNIIYDKGASFIKMCNHFIGRDAFKLGVREFFAKFKFQNAELNDFIQCLQLGSSKLGSNQELRLWASNWLTKAGVNELHPVIEKDTVRGTFSIGIRQSSSIHGDPVLQDQNIDIALYDQDLHEHIIQNVRVRGLELTPRVFEGKLDKLPAAILLNANNRGYCRLAFDSQSLNFFLNNLSKIQNPINRALIWRSLFDQARMRLLKPIDYLECVFSHFISETSDYMIRFILKDIHFVLEYYFNHAERRHLHQRYQKCLLDKLSYTQSSSQKFMLTTALLDETICADRDHDMLVQWLDLGRITNPSDNTVASILQQPHRYQIIQLLHRSGRLSEMELERRRNHEIQLTRSGLLLGSANLTTDFELGQGITLDAINLDMKSKEKLWQQYVEGKMSLKEFKMSSRYFYNKDDEQMCMYFGDKFFDVIEEVFAKQHRDYSRIFFKNLSPSFLGREVYLDRLIKILERATKTDNTYFINLIKEEIELMEEIIEIRSMQKVPL